MVLEKAYLTSKRRIANWWFEDETASVSAIGFEEFSNLLGMCAKCLSALSVHQLLFPVNIILSSAWIYYNQLGEHSGGVKKGEINIEVSGDESGTLRDLVLPRVLNNQLEKGFVYPASFEVRGKGIIIDELGNKVIVPDVTRIDALFMTGPVVDVSTSNYAWLPYSLSGEPQGEVYRNNAPRLESALKEIELALGVKGGADDHSDYCMINGYKLDNFRYDGEPMAVGELGGIL